MRYDIKQLTEVVKRYKYSPNSFAEIGSRDGHDTAYVSQYWGIQQNQCYIFEAHPHCHRSIIQTYPQFNVFNVAITNKKGVVEFNAGVVGVEPNIGISSMLDMEDVGFISQKVQVDGWRMDDVLAHIKLPGFDLLKIDVEGASLQVLEGFGKALCYSKFIQIELETKRVWKGQALHSDVVEFMEGKNFSVVDDVILAHDQNDTLFKNNTLC